MAIKQDIASGFGLGLGAGLSMIIYIVIGLAFLIPGAILLGREKKKPKEQRNGALVVVAYVLIVLGVICGLGLGAGFLLSNLFNE